jgi:hypothetical protein
MEASAEPYESFLLFRNARLFFVPAQGRPEASQCAHEQGGGTDLGALCLDGFEIQRPMEENLLKKLESMALLAYRNGHLQPWVPELDKTIGRPPIEEPQASEQLLARAHNDVDG